MAAHINDLLQAARQHAEEVIQPEVTGWNAAGVWPRAASDQAGASGLAGLLAPEALGGQALPPGDAVRVYEELARGDAAYAMGLSAHNVSVMLACAHGTQAFKDKWARDLASGRKLAAFCLTEPQSGSDAMNMKTRAVIRNDGAWVINGTKAWVSLAGEADVYCTVVKTSDAPGHGDMAMIAIPADTDGLRFGPRYETPSYNFLPVSEMYLENVVVGADNVILPVGQGLQGALKAIDIARVAMAAAACGLMQTALDTALRYAKARTITGGCVLDREGIRWMLGDVATELEAARQLYRAAGRALGTPEGPVMAAHAKRFAPDAAVKAANTCTQVLGGMGLLEPYGLDRVSRLAQMLRIVDGTTEINRVVIGRALARRAEELADLPVHSGDNGGADR